MVQNSALAGAIHRFHVETFNSSGNIAEGDVFVNEEWYHFRWVKNKHTFTIGGNASAIHCNIGDLSEVTKCYK